MSAGVTTRAQKRRMGQRDLWNVIVNNDDVCFKYILPRLNQTDVKFLFEVNSETRALIKRSCRENDLEKRFIVEEMSSISTLEFAWENRSLWSGLLFCERDFCYRVAKTNKLELLKWIREEKKCKWDDWTIDVAAKQGNLEMVKYCFPNQCLVNISVCAYAAENGHLECLKYLHEEACWNAAENGHLDCLKFLHETAKAPWDSYTVQLAHQNNHPECLQYLLDNDCPLPNGWRYEGRTLYTR